MTSDDLRGVSFAMLPRRIYHLTLEDFYSFNVWNLQPELQRQQHVPFNNIPQVLARLFEVIPLSEKPRRPGDFGNHNPVLVARVVSLFERLVHVVS